ncbi:hypothetical protein fh0823_18040 [Francisella halioticida]|uniref:hypothetical protein n=1 Tax=Francisella halioticida TaxID=549298 RepID=UPI001AF992C5|nr:hypothetical protein [Francisella halioticida]BCD91665.1 hypothetical protein fh0823_18040 [Francisella halioticida]
MSRCGQRVDISHKNPENLDFWNQVIDLIILGVQVPRMAINLYGGYESTLKKQFSNLKDIQIKDFVKEIGSMVSSTSSPSDIASSLGSTIKPFSGTSSFSLDGAQFATMRQNQGVAFYNLMVDGSKALKDYMNTGKDVKKVLDIFMAPKKAVNHGYNMRGINSLSNSL